jgi:hypothetical protein
MRGRQAAPAEPAAFRIWSVTAWGWEIMITWEPSTSTMSAPLAGPSSGRRRSRQVELNYPTGQDGETAVEFTIDPDRFHEAFAANLPDEQAALMAATQRPVAGLAFSEPNGPPAWKTLPCWAVVARAVLRMLSFSGRRHRSV